jgi:hypothetical protein
MSTSGISVGQTPGVGLVAPRRAAPAGYGGSPLGQYPRLGSPSFLMWESAELE